MKEELKKIMIESLYSVMPYIAYLGELKEFIKKEADECENIEAFIEKLKKLNEKSDIIRRTDGQIFLSELRRNLAKLGSD
jgi:predicted transcriptional regulator with HTH domain